MGFRSSKGTIIHKESYNLLCIHMAVFTNKRGGSAIELHSRVLRNTTQHNGPPFLRNPQMMVDLLKRLGGPLKPIYPNSQSINSSGCEEIVFCLGGNNKQLIYRQRHFWTKTFEI